MLNKPQIEQLIAGAAVWNIELDDRAIQRFDRYADLIVEWNQKMNLTRVPPESFVTLHFLDSLSGVPTITECGAATLIDVGTGAGLPGIPIALALTEMRVTLLDSTRKRLDFLNYVIEDLKLSSVKTVHERAEQRILSARGDAGRDVHDVAVARAVARMGTLASWLMPHVKPNGIALAYKSANAEAELLEAKEEMLRQGIECSRILDIEIPYTDILRKLIVIRRSVKRTAQGRTARR